jgi:hypothetical protein
MSDFSLIKCAKCGAPVRMPVDPEIDAVACVCGYFTEVRHG